jgi:VTC domain
MNIHERQGPDALQLANCTGTLESPSLSKSTGMAAPAYELKFLLTEQQSHEVHQRLSARMVPDTHADPSRGYAYETSSLYCDTPQFDVFHRVGSFKRRKHRLRRYGDAAAIFLERKSKWGDRVKKRRCLVPDADLSLLEAPLSSTTWPGHWFHQHVHRRGLLPVCTITYERVALVGLSAQGPLRLTFDRRIRGVPTNVWNVLTVADGIPLLSGRVICEFKYQVFLPAMFKEVIQDMRLTPSPVSKYRTLLRALGHVEAGGVSGNNECRSTNDEGMPKS